MKTNRRGFLKALGMTGTIAVAPLKAIEKTPREIAEEKHPKGSVESSGRMQVMKTSTRIGVSVEPGEEVILQSSKENEDWETVYLVSEKGCHVWLSSNNYKAFRICLVRIKQLCNTGLPDSMPPGYRKMGIKRYNNFSLPNRLIYKEIERITL